MLEGFGSLPVWSVYTKFLVATAAKKQLLVLVLSTGCSGKSSRVNDTVGSGTGGPGSSRGAGTFVL